MLLWCINKICMHKILLADEHNRMRQKKLITTIYADRLKHRGPDWSGLHQYRDCFLAHQRLAIIDPASGDQPLYNEDKSIVVTVIKDCYVQIFVS